MSDRQHLRALPSVDAVLRELEHLGVPRALAVTIVRRSLADLRIAETPPPDAAAIVAAIRAQIDALAQQRLRPVINATGIIIHTNLGRAPLAAEAVAAIASVASDYNNLEYDLKAGSRGGRAAYLEQSLATLCEAEAATVVNNCAASLVLILRHFTARPPRDRVLISRGEMIQIGGGFRVPDILVASGATIHEVGTTNRTTSADYQGAVDDRTAMILRVHRSNFYMEGFVESPPTAALAATARAAGVPFVDDLGSGATFDTSAVGDAGERAITPAASLREGANLVCFSGDKLLGGPQAGIIAGDAIHIAALKKDPLFRALRCDKLVLAGLQATVDLLLDGRADAVPIRSMMNENVENLRRRASQIQVALADTSLRLSIGTGDSEPGGGALPKVRINSITLDIGGTASPQKLVDALRTLETPIIAYVADGRVKLDLRTIFATQDNAVIAGLRRVAALCDEDRR